MAKRKGYVVKAGDSWAKIAGKEYGDQRYFEAIMRANPNIGMMRPGQVLYLPPRGGKKPVVSNAAAAAAGMATSSELAAGYAAGMTGAEILANRKATGAIPPVAYDDYKTTTPPIGANGQYTGNVPGAAAPTPPLAVPGAAAAAGVTGGTRGTAQPPIGANGQYTGYVPQAAPPLNPQGQFTGNVSGPQAAYYGSPQRQAQPSGNAPIGAGGGNYQSDYGPLYSPAPRSNVLPGAYSGLNQPYSTNAVPTKPGAATPTPSNLPPGTVPYTPEQKRAADAKATQAIVTQTDPPTVEIWEMSAMGLTPAQMIRQGYIFRDGHYIKASSTSDVSSGPYSYSSGPTYNTYYDPYAKPPRFTRGGRSSGSGGTGRLPTSTGVLNGNVTWRIHP